MLKTSSGKIITKKIHYCNSFLAKATGLMFRSSVAVKDTAWIFSFKRPLRVTVTMWFVFYPIDVIFLDEKNKIIELKKGLKPFTNYMTKKKIRAFIELESGSVVSKKLSIGMILSLK